MITSIPIYRSRYAIVKERLVTVASVACFLLIGLYGFLVVGSTVLSSSVRSLDKDIALIESRIAELEVEYFTRASEISPRDVSHLAMKRVSENAISYLVLEARQSNLAQAR